MWDEDATEYAVIDPGGDHERILDAIAQTHCSPSFILLTHGHTDHCFLAGRLSNELGVPVIAHRDELATIEGSLDFALMFYDLSGYVPVEPERLVEDGDTIRLGSSEIKVIHTPGHSPGGVCYATDVGIFCGDTIFAGSVGRTDFPGGSASQLLSSINTKLLILPDDTPLYPGHGPSTTVGAERRTNPYLH